MNATPRVRQPKMNKKKKHFVKQVNQIPQWYTMFKIPLPNFEHREYEAKKSGERPTKSSKVRYKQANIEQHPKEKTSKVLRCTLLHERFSSKNT